MKRSLLIAAIAMFAMSTTSTSANAQKAKKQVTVKSRAVDKSRGANPNIKGEMPTDDQKASKSRSTCYVTFNNYTGYYVKMYVNGYYMGTLYPYAKNYTVSAPDGYTTVYCITAGGTRDWAADGECTKWYTFNMYD